MGSLLGILGLLEFTSYVLDADMSQGISYIMAAPCHPANPRLHTAPLARTAFEGREPELVQGRSAKEPTKRFPWDDVK